MAVDKLALEEERIAAIEKVRRVSTWPGDSGKDLGEKVTRAVGEYWNKKAEEEKLRVHEVRLAMWHNCYPYKAYQAIKKYYSRIQ